MQSQLLKYFEFKHLPDNLQGTSKVFYDLVHLLDGQLPNGPEKTTCFRKLL